MAAITPKAGEITVTIANDPLTYFILTKKKMARRILEVLRERRERESDGGVDDCNAGRIMMTVVSK